MKALYVTMALFAGLTLPLAAQDQKIETSSKTKVTVRDGKDVMLTGCIQRSAGGMLTLTNVAGKDGALGSYFLVAGDDKDLNEYVGHRVEVQGKAADQGGGKVRVETETEVKPENGEKR